MFGRVLPSRRDVVAFCLLTTCSYFQVRSARSQQPAAGSAIIGAAISEAMGRTKELGALVETGTGPLPPAVISQFREGEIKTARTFLETIHTFSNDALTPFIDKQFTPYLALAQSEKVELAPAPQEVKPLTAQPVAQLSDQPIAPSKEDSLVALLWDILLDTWDLSSYKQVLKTTAIEYQPLREVLQQIAAAIGLGDWERLIGHLNKLIGVIFASAFLQFLEGKMGPELAKRFRVDVLKALTKRLAPFVGWALFGVGFVFAIRNNWERIQRYL